MSDTGVLGTGEPTTTRRRIWRVGARWSEHILALFGLVVLVYLVCFDLSVMVSGSMAPTLHGEAWRSGDRVLTERISYWFRSPRRWEVITMRNNLGSYAMKRVIGLPGEHIQMSRSGELRVDGQPVPRPERLQGIRYLAMGSLCENKVVDCGDGYFVMGDDSRDSDDSRFNPPVRPEEIIGRAWLIVSPAPRRGFVP